MLSEQTSIYLILGLGTMESSPKPQPVSVDSLLENDDIKKYTCDVILAKSILTDRSGNLEGLVFSMSHLLDCVAGPEFVKKSDYCSSLWGLERPLQHIEGFGGNTLSPSKSP